jgi:hypothetical protein
VAFTQEEILSVAGVLVILVGVVVYNNMRAMRPRPAAAVNPTATTEQPIVGRYVHHEGAVVGQAVALEGSRVLLRQGNVHKAVPLEQLERVGDELRLMGTIDWMESEREGSQWAARLPDKPAGV